MKSKTPFWKPLLLTVMLLTMFVSTSALFDVASSNKDAFFYLCGVLNILAYVCGIVVAYRYLMMNISIIKMTSKVADAIYEAFSRYRQTKSLPNKTFKTSVKNDDACVEVSFDKEADEVNLTITE